MHAFAGKRIEVGCGNTREGFTFTGFHLHYLALMQNDASEQLDVIRTLAKFSSCGFSGKRVCLGKQIFQRFSVFETFLELLGLGRKVFGRNGHCP